MERTEVGKGRYLITHTSEEIQELNRFCKISFHQSLIALLVSRRESATDPKKIQRLNNDIEKHIGIVDRLMSAPDINGYEISNDPISEAERQTGGVVHALFNENLPVEDAAKILDRIYEHDAPDSKTNT
jgi:hypothetical protein